MFYHEPHDNDLRLGDVISIEGLLSAIPVYNDIRKCDPSINDLIVTKQQYCVVLTPCCSIGESTIIVAPLLALDTQLFKNKYFVEDFTILNKRINGKYTISEEKFNELNEQDQTNLSNVNKYAFFNYFVYAPHESLQPYELEIKFKGTPRYKETVSHYIINFKNIFGIKSNSITDGIINSIKHQNKLSISHYMINFKNIFPIKSSTIKQDQDTNANNLGDIKILELSIESRRDLRRKLSFYYKKPALEDFDETEDKYEDMY